MALGADGGTRGELSGALVGTTALVTGASSGIGAATAQALAREGATVALVARRKERLDALAEKISGDGGNALPLQADVVDHEQVTTTVARVVAELGRLDTVINNAGILLNAQALDASVQEWERMISLNLLGSLYVAHAALPHLVKAAENPPRQVADLVNISSTAGRVARPGGSVYALTKFGLGAFAESLRAELHSRQVRVSVIEPGTVATELVTHIRADEREATRKLLETIEPLEPDDIADAVAYVVTRGRRVAVNELLVRATAQSW